MHSYLAVKRGLPVIMGFAIAYFSVIGNLREVNERCMPIVFRSLEKIKEGIKRDKSMSISYFFHTYQLLCPIAEMTQKAVVSGSIGYFITKVGVNYLEGKTIATLLRA